MSGKGQKFFQLLVVLCYNLTVLGGMLTRGKCLPLSHWVKKLILPHDVLINGLLCLPHLNCHSCKFMLNFQLKLIRQVNAFV